MPAFAQLKRGIQVAAERGYLRSLDGRRVKIRSAHSALNTLLQSAAGVISKKWICLVDTALRDEGLDDRTYMVAWVHDEIQIACKQGLEDHVRYYRWKNGARSWKLLSRSNAQLTQSTPGASPGLTATNEQLIEQLPMMAAVYTVLH